MKTRSPLAAAIAISVALIVLAGFFVPYPLLQQVRSLLIGWGVALAGVAALIGIAHLLGVHWRKLFGRNRTTLTSLLVLFSFLVTFLAGLWLTPSNPAFQQVVTSIQVPVETSLLAILTISLALASLRLARTRKGMMWPVFMLSAIFFLLSLSGLLPLQEHGITGFISRLPSAGGRGILLGIALGSLVTGLKILLGIDRPYNR